VRFEELYALMKSRQSIRSFRDMPLSEKQIRNLINAAVTAPSSLNSQPWSFVVIKGRGEKEKLRGIYTSARKKLGLYEQDTSFVEKATPIVVVCEDASQDKMMSCAMAIENMFLAAESMGLGSLPSVTILLSAEHEAQLAGMLNVKPPKKIALVNYFGHTDVAAPRKPKKDTAGLVFTDALGK